MIPQAADDFKAYTQTGYIFVTLTTDREYSSLN